MTCLTEMRPSYERQATVLTGRSGNSPLKTSITLGGSAMNVHESYPAPRDSGAAAIAGTPEIGRPVSRAEAVSPPGARKPGTS